MNPHYDIPNLKLTDKYLTDPILLALAWKRAHGYPMCQPSCRLNISEDNHGPLFTVSALKSASIIAHYTASH